MMKSSGLLPESLRTIVETAARDGISSPAAAQRLLRDAEISLDDVLPWAEFDHNAADGYGRNAVALGEKFELMVMSWAPGDFSAIHDHGSTEWGAVLYFGEAEHAVYKVVNDELQTVHRTQMRAGDVNQVDHTLIHQMGNSSDEPFVSVHLYGCDEPVGESGSVTADARIFDLEEQTIQLTSGGVFYCLPEDQIERREPGIRADAATTIVHHEQMLDRIERMVLAGEASVSHVAHANRLRAELERLQVIS